MQKNIAYCSDFHSCYLREETGFCDLTSHSKDLTAPCGANMAGDLFSFVWEHDFFLSA